MFDMSGRGAHSWADSFGPFPLFTGHYTTVDWNSYLVTHGEKYKLGVAHTMVIVRKGDGVTEGRLTMPGLELYVDLSRDK